MRLLFLLVVALHLFSHHTPASSAASIKALIRGQSLAAGDKLVSGNGKFALGFFQLAGAGSEPSRYTNRWHLGIWFNKIPMFTPVWVANREEPLADPSSSELTFSGDGNLVLLNRATNATVWSSGANVTAAANATVLVLLDTGNLVLRGSATDALWQSFDHLADTLLPDATIGLDKVTGRARRLVSRRNLLDQSPGVYSMELGLADVVQLLWNSSVPYWSSGDWNGQYQYFSSVPGMAARHLFDFTFVDDGREVSFAYHLRRQRGLGVQLPQGLLRGGARCLGAGRQNRRMQEGRSVGLLRRQRQRRRAGRQVLRRGSGEVAVRSTQRRRTRDKRG